MVIEMNKSEVIKEISKQTGYAEEKCILINNIMEDTFIFGKKNKEKIITRFENELNLDESESNKLYETVMNILGSGIKDTLKHPFKSKD